MEHGVQLPNGAGRQALLLLRGIQILKIIRTEYREPCATEEWCHV